MFENWIEQLIVIGHIALAMLLSGIIGYERETSEKPAGLRTNMIVGGVSCLVVLIAKILISDLAQEPFAEYLRSDPVRIIQSIIVGVSFIGAGTIFKSQGDSQIKFLTTAATLLFSAGIGIAVAVEQYIIAGGVTLMVWVINYIIAKTRFSEKGNETPDD